MNKQDKKAYKSYLKNELSKENKELAILERKNRNKEIVMKNFNIQNLRKDINSLNV